MSAPGRAPATQPATTVSPASESSDHGSSSDLTWLSTASARVAKEVIPSVVSVQAALNGASEFELDDLETYFGKIPQERFGSGVVVESDELVLTNYHVVRGARAISVVPDDGKTYSASLAGFDSLTDLALLRVPDLKATALQWADGQTPVPGQLVWAVGCPYNLDRSVSLGILSSNNRATLLDSPYQDFLQTDASINPGQSGGALVNEYGHLLGITTAIAGDYFQGIGFALPSSMARPVFAELRDHGQVLRGWIGVKLGPVSASRAALAGLNRSTGAHVEALLGGEDSPAALAGLKRGDICLQFEGREITGPLWLIRKIAQESIGSEVVLGVIRNEQRLNIRVRVSRRLP